MPVSLGRAGLGLCAAILFLITAVGTATAGTRLALVLGNSKYQNAPMLENPANDAQDLAQALRRLGFDVIEQHDAGRDAMVKAVRDFSDRLPGAELALFFYAGHGLQMSGENYLVPVDAKIQNAADIRFNTINLSDIQGEMEGSGRTSIIILDACRDNPFADKLAQSGRSLGTRGLVRMEAAAQGSLIVYSTQPNNVALDGTGRNSPFTAALLKHVTTPGLEVRQMISRVRGDVLAATDRKQTPWDSSSLVGDVYLASAPANSPTPASAASLPSTSAQPPSAPREAAVTAAAAPATPAPEQDSECDKAAAFHFLSTTAATIHETANTNWPHVVEVCEAELRAHPGDVQLTYDLGRAQEQLKNHLEALRLFRTAATAGHVDAMVELGVLYYRGYGVIQSYPTAFEWFSKAASAGSARAMGNLGAMYGNGFGVPKDYAKQLDWAERAVEAGDPFALNVVATAYFNGNGVPRDYKMAGQYFQQLADLGDGYALKFLANMYENGYLGPPDPAKASELRLEAERVDPGSQGPTHLPMLRQGAAPSPTVHRRRYVVFRRYNPYSVYNRDMGQPMVGGIFRAPAAGATCCPPSALICPGALPRC